jgi:UDP-3-O-[3-hydroxymyristoyl] glucosamine N-acyltransferase
MEWDIKELLSNIGIQYNYEGTRRKVKGVSSIFNAKEDDLSFCFYDGEKGNSLISKSNAGTILCTKSLEGLVHPSFDGQQLFFVENPKFALVQIMSQIYKKRILVGISPTVVISESAKIGSNCFIGNFTEIGENCNIGDNTVIYNRTYLMQNSSIGSGCIIGPGVNVGNDGFAFIRHESGEPERFPHLKGVKIGNNVDISGNSNVDRGSLSDTIIGDSTKIDALVHVAHNVTIGRNCELTAGTIIGGSTTIGDTCWTGLNSTVKDRIRVGKNVLVAAGAVVIHDVDDGDIVAGVPARSIKNKVTTDKVRLFMMAGQKGAAKKETSIL